MNTVKPYLSGPEFLERAVQPIPSEEMLAARALDELPDTEEALRALVEGGVDPNTKYKEENILECNHRYCQPIEVVVVFTTLYYALRAGDFDLAKKLLAMGANPNQRGQVLSESLDEKLSSACDDVRKSIDDCENPLFFKKFGLRKGKLMMKEECGVVAVVKFLTM